MVKKCDVCGLEKKMKRRLSFPEMGWMAIMEWCEECDERMLVKDE